MCWIKRFLITRQLIDSFLENCLISNAEWELCEQICEFLKIFERVTKLFSSIYYPTTSLVFYELSKITEIFYQCRNNDFLRDIIAPMEKNLIKILMNFLIFFTWLLLWILRLNFMDVNFYLKIFMKEWNIMIVLL